MNICHDCGLNAETPRGIIYVRRKTGKKYDNVPQCEACWLRCH